MLGTDTLLREIGQEIARDQSLRDYEGMYPIPWQLREVMEQRAEYWVQRLYDLCCDAYKNSGKELSAEFDRAVWAYGIEPFIMQEKPSATYGYGASKLLELLFCAVGSPPDKRKHLKVRHRDCCLAVRNKIRSSWQTRLLLGVRHHESAILTTSGAAQSAAARRRVEPTLVSSGYPTPTPPTASPVLGQTPTMSPPAIAAERPTQPSSTSPLAGQRDVVEPKPPSLPRDILEQQAGRTSKSFFSATIAHRFGSETNPPSLQTTQN